MTAASFFGLLTVLVLSALAAEGVAGRGRGWFRHEDTIANLNLAAGNLILGTVTVAAILAAYATVWAHRPVTLSDTVPHGAYLVLGFLLAELCQYWNHRLSHTYNLLAWGHVTHHSSSHLNLSTAPRVNWFYRSYSWAFYLPLPLLGYTVEEFVLFQVVMNVHNALCHTRFTLPWGPGPLRFVFVTPMAHRLHHSSDARHFGNYGASLLIWDHLFGTYRALDPGDDPEAIRYGIGANVDVADPIRLNFHGLFDLWATARAEGRSFVATLFSRSPPTIHTAAGRVALRVRPAVGWLLLAGVLALAVIVQVTHGIVAPAVHGVMVVVALGATVALGRGLSGEEVGSG